jgi:hypothetical protein
VLLSPLITNAVATTTIDYCTGESAVPGNLADTAEQRTATAAGVTLNTVTKALMAVSTERAEPWVSAAVYADTVLKDEDKAVEFLDRALVYAPRCKTALLIKVRSFLLKTDKL